MRRMKGRRLVALLRYLLITSRAARHAGRGVSNCWCRACSLDATSFYVFATFVKLSGVIYGRNHY